MNSASATPPVQLNIAGRSDIGLARRKNEDALLVADVASGTLLRSEAPQARLRVGARGVLLAVSDGMGGEPAGEVASAVVVEALARAMVGARPGGPTHERIAEAVQEANREVLEAAREPGREGMGATLTAMLVQARDDGARAFIAEVGDSRAYLLRSGAITRLTKDQSYVQYLVDSGALDEEQASESPFHNVILQAMGRQDRIDVALARVELRGRDCVLLCSDGLSNAATDDEIRTVVLGSNDPENACSRLVRLANERGGQDNITVIVAGVGGGLPHPGRASEPNLEILASFDPPTPT